MPVRTTIIVLMVIFAGLFFLSKPTKGSGTEKKTPRVIYKFPHP